MFSELLKYNLGAGVEAFSTRRESELPYPVIQGHQVHEAKVAFIDRPVEGKLLAAGEGNGSGLYAREPQGGPDGGDIRAREAGFNAIGAPQIEEGL